MRFIIKLSYCVHKSPFLSANTSLAAFRWPWHLWWVSGHHKFFGNQTKCRLKKHTYGDALIGSKTQEHRGRSTQNQEQIVCVCQKNGFFKMEHYMQTRSRSVYPNKNKKPSIEGMFRVESIKKTRTCQWRLNVHRKRVPNLDSMAKSDLRT